MSSSNGTLGWCTGETVERAAGPTIQGGRPYGFHITVISTSAGMQHLDLLVSVPQVSLCSAEHILQVTLPLCLRNRLDRTPPTCSRSHYLPRPPREISWSRSATQHPAPRAASFNLQLLQASKCLIVLRY